MMSSSANEINKQIERIINNQNTEPLEIIHMYYDDDYNYILSDFKKVPYINKIIKLYESYGIDEDIKFDNNKYL